MPTEQKAPEADAPRLEECADCLYLKASPKVSSRERRLARKRGCKTEGCANHATWLRRKRGPKGIVGPA